MCVSWAWTSVSIESKMGKMQGIEDTVMTRTVNPRASCLNIERSSVEAGHDSGRGPRQQLNGSEDGRCVLSALEPHGKRRQALTPMMMGAQPRGHWRRLWKPGWVGGGKAVWSWSREARGSSSDGRQKACGGGTPPVLVTWLAPAATLEVEETAGQCTCHPPSRVL